MPNIDDTTLLRLIASSKEQENDQAFRHLYQTCFGVIQKSILSNSGKDTDAEDIFQDALIVLYHQIKKGNLTLTSSLQTYLYSICRNLWLKKLRRSSREVELSDGLQQYVAIEESHLKTLEVDEEKVVIAKFLNQLDKGCKEVLTYFYFEKIRMAEIAKRMGLSSEQVAKNKKAGCMKKLKALFMQSEYFRGM